MVNENSDKIWEVLTKRWNLKIIRHLELDVVIRFNELKQSISGISANVLSDRLDELEKLGLVKRIVSDKTPLRVGYMLTDVCNNLKKIVLNLDEWVSLYQSSNVEQIDNHTNSVLSKQLLELLRKEITETEFNFIRDKLSLSFGIDQSNLLINLEKLKIILLELYGDEVGNKIMQKINTQIQL